MPEPQNVLPYERFPEHLPVASFPSAGEACMAASKLESEGVACEVVEHAILNGISAHGATIAVEAEQLQRAVEVLSATPARRWLKVKPAVPVQKADGPKAGRTPTRLLRRVRQWWGGFGPTPPPTTGR